MLPLVSFILAIGFPLSSHAQGNFDEVFAKDGVRPHYRQVWDIYSKLSEEKKKKFTRASIQDFRNDNALLPVPRVLTYSESELLKAGVEQRGRAIQAFLKDHYSGQKEYLKQKLIPQFVVDAATFRSKEIAIESMGSGASFNFWYGPDIIRDAAGQFRVVEDNLGFIGGMGDLIKARQSLVKNIPKYASIANETIRPDSFYQMIAERYHELARAKGGIPLLVTYRQSMSADNEDARVRQIFKKYGIESHQTNGINDGTASKLEMRADGVYFLKRTQGDTYSAQKVGHVVLDYEAIDFDSLDPNNRSKFLELRFKELEEVKTDDLEFNKVRKLYEEKPEAFSRWLSIYAKKHFEADPMLPTGYEGFWRRVREGKLSVTNNWGSEFANDKAFYMYVERLIRFYLKEVPILKNIATESAAIFDRHGIRINEAAVDRVLAEPSKYVIKGVTGRGGNEVWIGKKISAQELLRVIQMVRANPQYYIFQKYTPLSVMDGHIVDLRVLTDVSEKGTIASSIPWGRGVPMDANGKVNLAEQGRETTFLVHGKMCGLSGPAFN